MRSTYFNERGSESGGGSSSGGSRPRLMTGAPPGRTLTHTQGGYPLVEQRLDPPIANQLAGFGYRALPRPIARGYCQSAAAGDNRGPGPPGVS